MKQTKQEEKIDKIRSKHISEASIPLDKYFPQGSKKRGEALSIFAISFIAGMECQKEISELRFNKIFRRER